MDEKLHIEALEAMGKIKDNVIAELTATANRAFEQDRKTIADLEKQLTKKDGDLEDALKYLKETIQTATNAAGAILQLEAELTHTRADAAVEQALLRDSEAEVTRLTELVERCIRIHRNQIGVSNDWLPDGYKPSGDGKGLGGNSDTLQTQGVKPSELPAPETPEGKKHAPISPKDPLEKVER